MHDGPKLSRRQRAERVKFEGDVRAALEHAPTRRLLASIFDMTGLYADVVDVDPIGVGVATGRRAVGLSLRAMIDSVDPLAFVAIEAEAINRKLEAKRSADSAKRESDVPTLE